MESGVDERTYRQRIRAWILYDWAESAFVTTIVAAVLPVYYSQVAGATLPSAARATQAFSLTTSIALGIAAILSPLLGAYSDISAAKKRLLTIFMAIGVTATGLMVLIGEGDWVLASALFIIGRVGFSSANVFYDALLPHVARPADQDRVSAQGYAFGYLGGGLLLAVNVAMILTLPEDNLGTRLSFLTVAVWWAVFSVPILRRVPEPPPTGTAGEGSGLRATLQQVREMIRDLTRFDDLRRFLISYLIYNDGINVVIGVAAIYGAELGFASTDLILAILLVQFAGMPYSLAFGQLPNRTGRRNARITAFIVLNIVLLPVVGLGGRLLLPDDVTGARPAPFEGDATATGQGEADLDARGVTLDGDWSRRAVAAGLLDADEDAELAVTASGAFQVEYVGADIELRYVEGPEFGVFGVEVDGRVVMDGDEPLRVDASRDTDRYGEHVDIEVEEAGRHTLRVFPVGDPGEAGGGEALGVMSVEVLPPARAASLPTILGLILALQVVIALLAFLLGPTVFLRWADALDTKRSIQLSLTAYAVIGVWGFLLDTVIEFWTLAWLVSVVQGGSQALSRSLYATLVPDSRSGEFFGLFSILSKAASFISPLLFVVAVAIWDSSRPAVLALSMVFFIGIGLLRRVDVAAGRATAEAADAAAAGGTS